MTFEELMGISLAHAANAEGMLARVGPAMSTGEAINVPYYLSMAQSYALLAETYARLASAQIVNGTSMNTMMLNLAGVTPVGPSS